MGLIDMSGYGFIVSKYGKSPFATGSRRYEDSKTRWRDSLGCDTFPLFTGGLRGSFRFPDRLASSAQRFSSTAVYPPCPSAACVNPGACTPGHGGYTASGSGCTVMKIRRMLPGIIVGGAHLAFCLLFFAFYFASAESGEEYGLQSFPALRSMDCSAFAVADH